MELAKIVPQPSSADESTSRQLEDLRDRLCSAIRIADQIVPPASPQFDQLVTERQIRAMLQLRRQRDRFFDGDIFADPAWDILLELYAATLGQFRVSISNLCVGAAVPATTALRWIKQLEDQGLIERRADPTDGRRHFVMLSHKGLGAMNAYFRTVPAAAFLT